MSPICISARWQNDLPGNLRVSASSPPPSQGPSARRHQRGDPCEARSGWTPSNTTICRTGRAVSTRAPGCACTRASSGSILATRWMNSAGYFRTGTAARVPRFGESPRSWPTRFRTRVSSGKPNGGAARATPTHSKGSPGVPLHAQFARSGGAAGSVPSSTRPARSLLVESRCHFLRLPYAADAFAAISLTTAAIRVQWQVAERYNPAEPDVRRQELVSWTPNLLQLEEAHETAYYRSARSRSSRRSPCLRRRSRPRPPRCGRPTSSSFPHRRKWSMRCSSLPR